MSSDSFYDQDEQKSLEAIKDIFQRVDEFMFRFCHQFSENHLKPVKGEKWPGKYIETDALGIFTHVISHEFHHKGQAMTMARLLGYTPPDTDVMRF